jgi:5'-AMP-activated protein kinase, regulatory gamma subunit
VITLIKGGIYDDLNLSVGEALLKRSDVSLDFVSSPSVSEESWSDSELENEGPNPLEDFAGIYTCSGSDRLDTILDTIRKSRVHRFVVVDDAGRLKGLLTLSDILSYLLLEGEGEGE